MTLSHKKGSIKISNKNIEQEHISISYPQLKSKHKKTNHNINKIICHMIDTIIEEFQELKDKMSMHGDCQIRLNKRNLISLTIEIFYFSEEEKSDFSVVKSLTANVINSYEYSLKDFFQEKSNYENVLNKIILQKIKDNDIAIIEEFGNISNRSFYLTEDSLVIYYNLHRNSRYSSIYFSPEFSISYNSMKAIICPKGPLALLRR